ncbi:MAG: DUF2344 domain-containing protein [Lachnospiraceae bacterium]|nr:DUF2344 domain-containing protein [Lachnospiraceae bacterium]
MKVRIKFSKHGPVKFIGHLDVMRYFQKTIRRSGLDIVYTTGFSPHQIMSFAAPLGVGLESNGEYLDIELHSITSCQDIVEKLNREGVEGMRVLSARVLPENAGNAMASVAAAEYTIHFRDGREPRFDYKKEISAFSAKERIPIVKETKKNTLEVDLKPGIYKLDVKGDDIHMLVDASSSGNIKPSMVIDAFMEAYGEKLPENAYTITREDTYLNLGSAEEPVFAPLDQCGQIV